MSLNVGCSICLFKAGSFMIASRNRSSCARLSSFVSIPAGEKAENRREKTNGSKKRSERERERDTCDSDEFVIKRKGEYGLGQLAEPHLHQSRHNRRIGVRRKLHVLACENAVRALAPPLDNRSKLLLLLLSTLIELSPVMLHLTLLSGKPKESLRCQR
jgi:hypothetical protein